MISVPLTFSLPLGNSPTFPGFPGQWSFWTRSTKAHKKTQNTDPNRWPSLIHSSSTTALLTARVWLPLCRLSFRQATNNFVQKNPTKYSPNCMSDCVRSQEGCRGFTDRTWSINQWTISLTPAATNGLQHIETWCKTYRVAIHQVHACNCINK